MSYIMTGWFEYGVSNDSSHYYSQETEVQLLRQRRHHRDDHRNHEEGVTNPYTQILTM